MRPAAQCEATESYLSIAGYSTSIENHLGFAERKRKLPAEDIYRLLETYWE